MAMRTVTVVRQYLASVFFIAIGLMASGCGDTATVNPVVELASLTVTPGTLQPAFNGGTTQYRVQVTTDITSVRVTAQPAVAGDTVTINGQTTTSRDIPLGEPGSTTPVNIVVSETDTNSRTYTVLVNRAGLAGNNSLASLTVSPGTLAPDFSANIQNYAVDVANNVGSITVTPTLSDPVATMTVNGQSAISGQASIISLNNAGQNTVVPIVVTAQNGSPKTYLVTVDRGVSGNNFLQSLSVSPGSLTPAFNSGTVGYTVNVASNVTSVTITPRVQDPAATMTVNGQATNSGQARPITLLGAGSSTPITIVVTAQNGTQQTYAVGIIRAALGGNNNLSGLTVSPGTLAPAFSSGREDYTVNVANSVTSITVTPREQDTAATTTVNGQATNSGQARTVQLNGAGTNTLINIVVTAPNGTQKTYSANVVRAAFGGNNNLSALSVTPGDLNPEFDVDTLVYSVNVGNNIESVSVRPTRQNSTATITVNGQATTSGQPRTVNLNPAGQTTIIPIVVTAQNGIPKTYTMSVNRAALGGNNNLSTLTVSPGSLSPSFTAARTSYAVNAGSGVDSINVTASKADSNAGMTINGQGTNSGQTRSISLNPAGESTEIDITVTAQNNEQKIYTVTVNRQALGGNNNLSALTVSPGTLSPAFSAARVNTDYAVNNVSSSATAITVTATPQDSSATVTINGQGGNSRSIPLPTGPSSTEIDVRVIAPNGNDKTYLITVNQPAPVAPPPAQPANAPDLIAQDDSCLLKFGITPTGTNDDCEPNSGTNRDDNFTNVTTPRFRIPQPGAGETPSLYVDGIKVDSTFDQGTSTLKPTAALSGSNEGVQHSITSTVTNTTTNLESDQSGALIVTISTGQSGV